MALHAMERRGAVAVQTDEVSSTTWLVLTPWPLYPVCRFLWLGLHDTRYNLGKT